MVTQPRFWTVSGQVRSLNHYDNNPLPHSTDPRSSGVSCLCSPHVTKVISLFINSSRDNFKTSVLSRSLDLL